MQEDKALVKILSDLVAFRTVSGEHADASKCLDYADSYLAKRGMLVNRLEFNGFPSLIATTRPTKKPKLLLQAHIDVVCAPEACYKLVKKSGKLFGRGVFDMKFAAAIFLKIADDLQASLADYDFGIMLTSDEEVGGRDGVKALLDAGYGADVCILPDAGDSWQIETSHKGAWIGLATASGMSAHGSRPWEGDNAIDRLVDALREMRELFDGQHANSDTLSVNKIFGGTVMNQVADKAEATLDMRCLSNKSFDRLHGNMETIATRHGVSLATVTQFPISETDITHPLVASFLGIAEKVRGKPPGRIRSLGTSDAHYFAESGIPVILMRPDGGAAHGDGEWIDKDGLKKYHSVIRTYVEEICTIKA